MTIIETKSRSNLLSWGVYIFFGTLTLIGSPIGFMKTLSNDSNNSLKLLPVFIIQFIIGVLCLRMVLWFIKGKESIIVRDNQIWINKSGTFWIKRQKKFDLNEVKNIVLNKSFIEENSPSTHVHDFSRQNYIFRIQNTGRIKVIYKGYNSFNFLDNISPAEALEIIDKIKNAGNIN
jgi:hypothetical protein